MAQPLDLDAYLKRISYTGPRTPTYDTPASSALTPPASPSKASMFSSADLSGSTRKVCKPRSSPATAAVLLRTRKPHARCYRGNGLCPSQAPLACAPL